LIGIAFLYFNKKENMKAIKNKVQLVGRLGADPEMKIYGEDKKLANLRLAVNDRYKNVKGEWMDETQWFSLIAWSKLAIYVEKYLTKGAEVAVEGRLVNKSFTDKAGIKRSTTEIVLSEILILSKQKELQLKN
jgi:single-strand DNA-binding protein